MTVEEYYTYSLGVLEQLNKMAPVRHAVTKDILFTDFYFHEKLQISCIFSILSLCVREFDRARYLAQLILKSMNFDYPDDKENFDYNVVCWLVYSQRFKLINNS